MSAETIETAKRALAKLAQRSYDNLVNGAPGLSMEEYRQMRHLEHLTGCRYTPIDGRFVALIPNPNAPKDSRDWRSQSRASLEAAERAWARGDK